MAQAKQWTNPLQEAIGKLTGLGPDKLPESIPYEWQSEYIEAANGSGHPLAIVDKQPTDKPFVAVWPGNNGLTAQYAGKTEKVVFTYPHVVFLVQAAPAQEQSSDGK